MKFLRNRIQLIALCYLAAILSFAVLPPFVGVWNRIHPHIFGFPFAQFSILAFAAALSGGLVVWYVSEGRLNRKESIARARSMSNE